MLLSLQHLFSPSLNYCPYCRPGKLMNSSGEKQYAVKKETLLPLLMCVVTFHFMKCSTLSILSKLNLYKIEIIKYVFKNGFSLKTFCCQNQFNFICYIQLARKIQFLINNFFTIILGFNSTLRNIHN